MQGSSLQELTPGCPRSLAWQTWSVGTKGFWRGLASRAQGQCLAPGLWRVCLIPDKEVTPGTWLANRHYPSNGTRGSANPSAPANTPHPHQDHLLPPWHYKVGISQTYVSFWLPTHLWHSMAWGQQGRGHMGRARAYGDIVQGKSRCPILCQTQLDLCQSQLPQPILPHGLPGHRAKEGAWGQGEGLALWPCHTDSTQGFRASQVPAATLALWHLGCSWKPAFSLPHQLALWLAVCP